MSHLPATADMFLGGGIVFRHRLVVPAWPWVGFSAFSLNRVSELPTSRTIYQYHLKIISV